jgi:RNA polymerase sigma-54 factor
MNEEEETVAVEKFAKENVQDYEDWEEHGYDDVPDYKLEYENYFNSETLFQMFQLKAFSDYREALKDQIRYMGLSDKAFNLQIILLTALTAMGFYCRTLKIWLTTYLLSKVYCRSKMNLRST